MGEVVFLVVLIVLGIVMFFSTYSFPTSIIDQSGGPRLFPQVVIILLIIFVIARIIMILRDEAERAKPFAFLEIFKGSRLVFLLSFLAYSLLMTTLGFFLSSSIFLSAMVIFLYYCQYGKWIALKRGVCTTVISFVGVFAVYYAFTRWLNVLLPSGILKF